MHLSVYLFFFGRTKDLSAGIHDDQLFELMMRNAWHMSGGVGQVANSSNLRVLVTYLDGSQEVVEVKDDLGLNRKDTKVGVDISHVYVCPLKRFEGGKAQ